MSWRRSWAIVRNDARILRKDPTFLVVSIVMPILLMTFLKPAFRAALALAGVEGATGAEQAVPGIAVMFASFTVGSVGLGVFREHGWNTWERLRASPIRPAEIVVGKVVIPLLVLALQFTVLFGIGGVALGFRVRGSPIALGLVAGSLAVAVVAYGLLLLAVCRSVIQLNAIANLGAVLFAGLGGAITPISLLPGWVRSIAPSVPTYWAMRGFRSVVVHRGGVGEVALPVAVLLAVAAGFLLLAVSRFRLEETKISWA